MTNPRPKALGWGRSLWLLMMLGIVTASGIGYAVGFRLTGYAPLPLEAYWAGLWIVLAAGFVADRALAASLVSLLGFLAGLIATPFLMTDPYAIWGGRALLSLLSLSSALFALATWGARRKKRKGDET